jgi:hypothetical protein
VLICGGMPDNNTCEIINLESSVIACKNMPNFPAMTSGAFGGLGFNENPIICGGQNKIHSKRCFSLENKEWVSHANMSSARAYTISSQLQNGNILVAGGINDSGSYLNSAEILTKQGWESNIPPLPVRIWSHCMVTVNSTTVMVISGGQNELYSEKTFYYTVGDESWNEGPKLKFYRNGHSCGKIRKNKDSQEMSIIVAGGYDGPSYLSSVEILHESSNEWQTGPELPFGISLSQMVEDQNGGVVLIGGESEFEANLDTLYHLPHGGENAVWTKMEQKLKIGRYSHTAFLVPDNIVDCS